MTEAIQATGLYKTVAPVVMAFPSVIQARAFKRDGKEKGEPKFGGTFVFDPAGDDAKAMKALVVSLSRAKWPGLDIGAALKAGTFASPFKSGDKEIEKKKANLAKFGKTYNGDADYMAGKLVLKASSKYRPGLAILQPSEVAGQIGKIIDLNDTTIAVHASKFYFGVHVLALFKFVPYDAVGDNGKDGCTAYLQTVVSLNTGKKLSNAATAEETFHGYVGHSTPEDPTAGDNALDDEIPF